MPRRIYVAESLEEIRQNQALVGAATVCRQE